MTQEYPEYVYADSDEDFNMEIGEDEGVSLLLALTYVMDIWGLIIKTLDEFATHYKVRTWKMVDGGRRVWYLTCTEVTDNSVALTKTCHAINKANLTWRRKEFELFRLGVIGAQGLNGPECACWKTASWHVVSFPSTCRKRHRDNVLNNYSIGYMIKVTTETGSENAQVVIDWDKNGDAESNDDGDIEEICDDRNSSE